MRRKGNGFTAAFVLIVVVTIGCTTNMLHTKYTTTQDDTAEATTFLSPHQQVRVFDRALNDVSAVSLREDVIIASETSPSSSVVDPATAERRITHEEERQSSKATTIDRKKKLGAVVLLAPKRWAKYNFHSKSGLRFCLLAHAIESIEQRLNSRFGPYDIHVLYASDPSSDDDPEDDDYTDADMRVLNEFARFGHKSKGEVRPIYFHAIPMMSGNALEPNTTVDLIKKWRTGRGYEGSVPGRDLGYQSMCRLWSGRLQQMDFLDDYEYYMRLDDDSLFTKDLTEDPFQMMQRSNLTYGYRRDAVDIHGIEHLMEVARRHGVVNETGDDDGSLLPFWTPESVNTFSQIQQFKLSYQKDPKKATDGKVMVYKGSQPYNNFHVTRVNFWRSSFWNAFWKDMNDSHLFFKYRVGDANVHAVAVMMMHIRKLGYEEWGTSFPYKHNINDGGWYPPKDGEWEDRCRMVYDRHGVPSSRPTLEQ